MSKEELQAAPAVIKLTKNRKEELWVASAQKEEVFDWPVFSELPDFPDYYRGRGEKDREGARRKIGCLKTNFLRFRMPPPEAEEPETH